MPDFCQVLISATSKAEANAISAALVNRKLVAGSLIVKGDSRYWWKKKVVKKHYYNISCFSLKGNKQKIIAEVKKLHADECPIIAFFDMDGNEEFLNWIKESVQI